MFAPIGINKLYAPPGELIPAKIAGELGLPVSRLSFKNNLCDGIIFQYCLSTAASQSIEDVAVANDAAAQKKNESNSVYTYCGAPKSNTSSSPRFFQLYMGHDDEIVSSG